MGCSVCVKCKNNCYNDGLCPTCIQRRKERKAKKKKYKPVDTAQILQDTPPWE
jgi:hypothetical protein